MPAQFFTYFLLLINSLMKKNLLTILVVFYSILTFSQTTLTLQPGAEGKDSRIWSKPDMVNNNAGTSEYGGATAWTWSGVEGVMQLLVQFDLSAIPTGAVITDAKLSMYHYVSSLNMDNGDNALYIKRITSTWDESTVTWANKPTVTETNKVSVAAFATGTNMLDVNVTQLVKDMITNSNNGFLIMLQTEQKYRTFNAVMSDHAEAAKRPKLVVTYTVVSGLQKASNVEEIGLEVYPNPSAESSLVDFNLSNAGNVSIDILTTDGRIVKSVSNEYLSIGNHQVSLGIKDASYAPGIYLVKLVTGDRVYTKKLVIK
jgi:hypothetical protein